jgi:hypothetical protein
MLMDRWDQLTLKLAHLEVVMDRLDQVILNAAYTRIEESASKRVAGSTIWDDVKGPHVAPVMIPARLKRLISLGLLSKDEANSSSRTKVYAPTDAGYEAWRR